MDEDLQQKVRSLRDEAKDVWKKLGGGLLAVGLNESVEQLNELYPYMQYLSQLVFMFDTAFAAKAGKRHNRLQ